MATAQISDKHPDYSRRITQWLKVRDAIEGEEVIKDRGSRYLPRPTGLNSIQYGRYKERSVFYGITDRTLGGLVGLVFRVEPTVNLPVAIEDMKLHATPEGDTIDTVLWNTTRETLSVGRYGVLIDLPSEVTTDALPYLAEYAAENIWRWEERTIGGKRQVTRVVVRDNTELDDQSEVTKLRELFLDDQTGNYTVQLWEERTTEARSTGIGTTSLIDAQEQILESGAFERKGSAVVPQLRGRPLLEIPFVFVNPHSLTPTPEKSPMMDLVNMNLAHYRNSADFEHALYLTAQPTPWLVGPVDQIKKPKSIGGGAFWVFPTGTTVGMLEFKGAGINAIKEAMAAKESRMAALGARLIDTQVDRSNVTAETTRLQSREETSILVSTVGNVELAFTKIFRLAAEWSGSDPDEVEITLNRDFVETRLDPGEIQALVGGWQQGAYSHQTLWENLQRGEVADPKRTLEEELALLEEEGGPPAAPAPKDPFGGGGEDDEAEEDADEET